MPCARLSTVVEEPQKIDRIDLIYVQAMLREIPEILGLGKIHHGVGMLR